MKSDAIINDDATTYIEHVSGHNIDADIQWLLDEGHFPVGAYVLDIGCGTGRLVKALCEDNIYSRFVIGVEQSPQLASHAAQLNSSNRAKIVEGDFLNWILPREWSPDIAVMSYFLHHCDNADEFIAHVYSCLPPGGTLYVVDRVALHDNAIPEFEQYWANHYKGAHEWDEPQPRIRTIQQISDIASSAGFTLVNFKLNPFDQKIGVDLFPKSLMEFCKDGSLFPSVLISPFHREYVGEIQDKLISETSSVGFSSYSIPYTKEVIDQLYSRCPWVKVLGEFIDDQVELQPSTLLVPQGLEERNHAQLFRELSVFKKKYREDWPMFNIEGDTRPVRPLVFPFHVPEPQDSRLMKKLWERAMENVT